MKWTILALAFLASIAALAQPVTDNEINQAYELCQSHRALGIPPGVVTAAERDKYGFAAGWEQCEAIATEFHVRQEQQRTNQLNSIIKRLGK